MADRFASMEAKPKSEPSACTMEGALRHGVKRMHGLPLNHIEVNNIQTPENNKTQQTAYFIQVQKPTCSEKVSRPPQNLLDL